MSNKLICLIGPSGCGKTTASEYLVNNYGLKSIQSYTTRAPRYDGETGHVFVSEDDMETMRSSMVAYNKFHGNHYWATVDQIDNNDIYVVDIPGFIQLKEKYNGDKQIIAIGLDISPEVSFNRIVGRGETEEFARSRMENDAVEFANFKKYCDFVINTENNTVEETAKEILSYI